MRPTVLLAADLAADDALAWAQYGAMQALTMLGVSFDVATAAELTRRGEVPLLIDPALGIKARVKGTDVCEPVPLGPTVDFLQLAGELPDTGNRDAETLPCLGPLAEPGAGLPSALSFDWPGEPLPRRHACRLFVSIGLYLSRFSWTGNSVTEGSFVRQIDRLWDDGLSQRWGRIPVVDEYLAMIEDALVTLYHDLGVPYVKKWPHPIRDGEVCTHGLILTHDVDAVYATAEFREAAQAPSTDCGASDPLRPPHQSGNVWFNFRRWVDLESRLGVKSAFFLLSPRPDLSYWCTPGYNVSDPAVAAAARRLAQLGWEVSVHQLGHDRQELLDGERRQFEAAVGIPPTGTRSHYLKHLPHTLALKAAAGMTYDSTWYAETTESSFLCGTTFPFAPFDPGQVARPLPLWEFSFVVEDGIIFRAYGEAGRTVEEAIADGKQALGRVLRHNGYACLNAHQRTFAQMSKYPEMPDDWTPAYEQLIRYFQASSACLWSPLPRELAAWWTARERVAVEPLREGVAVTNQGRAPIGDLVICSATNGRRSGRMWAGLSDNRGRNWFARPVGLLRPGETRLLSW